MDSTETVGADAGEHHGLSQRAEAALDSLARRLDHGGDLPDVPAEVSDGAALTEREAAAKLRDRRIEREDEADRARQRAKDAGIQVREMTDPIPIRLVNGRDPSLPPELEDGTRVNPKAGAGINMRQAAAVLGQARSQTDELRQQQAEELQSLFGDNSAPADQAAPDAAQPDLAQQPVEYSEEERAAFRERYNAAVAREQQEMAQLRQARAQYEGALPQLLQTLQYQQVGEFGDIKSIADVERMAREDQNRYLRWDLTQKKTAAVAQEYQAALQRQQAEAQQQWQQYAKHHDAEVERLIPELKDEHSPAARELRDRSLKTLKDAGFDEGGLRQAWQGRTAISLRDSRVQLIISKAAKWDAAQAAGREMQAKPLPPVMRPGVSHPRGAANGRDMAGLLSKASSSRGINPKEAVRLMQARRGAR